MVCRGGALLRLSENFCKSINKVKKFAYAKVSLLEGDGTAKGRDGRSFKALLFRINFILMKISMQKTPPVSLIIARYKNGTIIL